MHDFVFFFFSSVATLFLLSLARPTSTVHTRSHAVRLSHFCNKMDRTSTCGRFVADVLLIFDLHATMWHNV